MGKGATAMKHARAAIQARYPCAPLLEAQKVVVWIWDRRRGERRPISRAEDLFGVFDLMAFPARPDLTCAVQVTTETANRSTTSNRKRKIRRWLEAHYPGEEPPFRIQLWAWVARRHFRVHEWIDADWHEMPPLASPLLKRAGPAPPAQTSLRAADAGSAAPPVQGRPRAAALRDLA